MSDPVRITNPGAESLGYDSDGHEIMAVDIYVNPPRVDVFHGTPPAWSSFGNKTIWGGNEWVDDSPTRSDIEKRDKEITAYKNTLSAQQKENENKRTEAGKRLSAAIAAREKDENTLKTLRAGNADAADITRQEFRLLQAELREYGFRTEIAGYDALRLHTESRMLFADADSLRISPREARSLIEQAEKQQKDAQNADKKAADGVHLENGKYPTLRAFFKQPVQRSEIESLYDVYESHILGKVHENPVVVVREPHSFFRIAYIQVSSYFL